MNISNAEHSHALSSLALRATRTSVLVFAAALGAALPALAADPDVRVVVTAEPDTPRPATVTYQRALLATYAAYQVKITNDGKNVLNHVRFEGETLVGTELAVRTAEFFTAAGAVCSTTNAARTKVVCELGQFRARGDSQTFTLIFKAPTECAATESCAAIKFTTDTYYSEGSGDSGGASHVDFTRVVETTELGTPNTTGTKSSVPPGQANTFFTGLTVAATSDDPVKTSVAIPSQPFFTTASIVENENLGGTACTGTLGCVASALSIPHPTNVYFSILQITLSRDAKTLLNGAKPADLKVFYTPDGPLAQQIPLKTCASSTQAEPLPRPGNPCIDYVKIYGNQKSLGEQAGDAEIGVKAVENGVFNF